MGFRHPPIPTGSSSMQHIRMINYRLLLALVVLLTAHAWLGHSMACASWLPFSRDPSSVRPEGARSRLGSFPSWTLWRMPESLPHRQERLCQQELEHLRWWFKEAHRPTQVPVLPSGHQDDPVGSESRRSAASGLEANQAKHTGPGTFLSAGDHWSVRGMEDLQRGAKLEEIDRGKKEAHGEGSRKKGDAGREARVADEGNIFENSQKHPAKSRVLQEGEESEQEYDEKEEEGRSLEEDGDDRDGNSKRISVTDALGLVSNPRQARMRRRLAGKVPLSAKLANCVPCTSRGKKRVLIKGSWDDDEESKLQGVLSRPGSGREQIAGEMTEADGGNPSFRNDGLDLEGSRKLLLASAPCCDPLLLRLQEQTVALERLMAEIAEKQVESKRVSREKYVLNKKLSRADINWEAAFLGNQTMYEAQQTVQRCNGHGIVAREGTLVWKGYTCDASDEALRLYRAYDASGLCPDDWFATQSLIFHHHCFSLPQRRCLARTTNQTISPLPFPQALFNLSALIDAALLWDRHACSSFACLNARVVGDCRLCFNLTLERNRWRVRYRGSLTVADVLKMKKGSIRLGVDIGGGTGSFAAHMALYNVTILTTAMNVETVVGRKQGLPYMEAIALRGLIPLHLPHKVVCLLRMLNEGRFLCYVLDNVTILTTAVSVGTVVGRKQGLPYLDAIALRGLTPLYLPHKVSLLSAEYSLCSVRSPLQCDHPDLTTPQQ
ncbi:hypothetical protein CLOM_g11479 [Closterium sp. NIES-68]|nr:hypothetical protein CLOM_g11479 [Closterium sp. NIES-68]